MSKLLRSNMFRLSKTKIVWFDLFLLFAVTIVVMLNNCRQAIHMHELGYVGYNTMDKYYFLLVPIIGIFMCVAISLFLGTDYADGTIRNKMIVGYTRKEIYLSNLLMSFIISFAFTAVYFGGSLIGLTKLEPWKISGGQLLLCILVCVINSFAIASILTLIGMISHSKVATAIISVFIVPGMILAAAVIYSKLQEPEMTSGMIITANGIEAGEPQPNPSYVGGTMRSVLQLLIQILPAGQGILIANGDIENAGLFILYSFVIMLATTVFGIFVFRKKDLK